MSTIELMALSGTSDPPMKSSVRFGSKPKNDQSTIVELVMTSVRSEENPLSTTTSDAIK